MISLKNVSVIFDDLKAVDSVSLEIEKGDIFGIVGFSGAGKSTLVRCINLLQKPSSGKILIDGKEIQNLKNDSLKELRKKISMIFQNFALLPSRTVIENVIFPIRKSKLSKNEQIKKAEALLKLVGIYDKKDFYPSQLSGGQKQRCAIARALASDPQILLCDESTSALDPKTTKQILKLLKELNQKLDLTMVIITHQMEVVKDICNKCAFMEKGKLLESGPSFEIFSNPKNELTKDFIDSTLTYKATLKKILSGQIKIKENELLAELKYHGNIAVEPVLSIIYEKWKIKSNILSGSIETIDNKIVGNLLIGLSGDNSKIQDAIKYLKEKNTNLQILGGKYGL